MPWKKEHKSETRGRILEKASGALRGRGVAGIGVAQVMEDAGLTHGGFYAHFGSKDDLIANALAFACEQSRSVLERAAERAPEGEKLQAIAGSYLTPDHARNPERGCPLAALGSEVVRDEGPAREAFANHIRDRLAWLETLSTAETKEERRREAAGTYAAMIGGLMLARALGGEEGDKYMARVRRFLDRD
jgi:TetR/AcrR family transcriptional regulator, transcriptional repressor for nem operon